MSARNFFLYLKRDDVPRLGDQGKPLFQKVVFPVFPNPRLLDPLPCLDRQFIQREEEYGHESNYRQGEVKTESRLRSLGLFLPVGVGRVVMWLDSDEVVRALLSAPKWFFA